MIGFNGKYLIRIIDVNFPMLYLIVCIEIWGNRLYATAALNVCFELIFHKAYDAKHLPVELNFCRSIHKHPIDHELPVKTGLVLRMMCASSLFRLIQFRPMVYVQK